MDNKEHRQIELTASEQEILRGSSGSVLQKVMETVNSTGGIYLTHTKLNGQFVLRMSIGQTKTEERHVARAWELLQAAAQKI